MPQPNIINSDTHFRENVTFAKQPTFPTGAWDDDDIAAAANIAASKLQHRVPLAYHQAPGTAVVAATADVFIARADGDLISFEAAITGALADDASRHVTIDLQKSTSGGAFATVLTAVIDLTSSSTLRTAVAAAISSAPFVDGDIFRIVVAVSGGGGNQAQGLCVSLRLDEEPN